MWYLAFSSYRLNPILPIDYDDWTTFFIQKAIYLLQNVLDVYWLVSKFLIFSLFLRWYHSLWRYTDVLLGILIRTIGQNVINLLGRFIYLSNKYLTWFLSIETPPPPSFFLLPSCRISYMNQLISLRYVTCGFQIQTIFL